MIRPIEKKDREAYLKMAEIFYNSNAVLSPVPKENFEKTFHGVKLVAVCDLIRERAEAKKANYALVQLFAEQFRQQLAPGYLRRTRQDVLQELPELVNGAVEGSDMADLMENLVLHFVI